MGAEREERVGAGSSGGQQLSLHTPGDRLLPRFPHGDFTLGTFRACAGAGGFPATTRCRDTAGLSLAGWPPPWPLHPADPVKVLHVGPLH